MGQLCPSVIDSLCWMSEFRFFLPLGDSKQATDRYKILYQSLYQSLSKHQEKRTDDYMIGTQHFGLKARAGKKIEDWKI